MKPTAGLSILGCDVLALFGSFFFFPLFLFTCLLKQALILEHTSILSHLSFLLTIRVYMKSSHVYSQTTVAFYTSALDFLYSTPLCGLMLCLIIFFFSCVLFWGDELFPALALKVHTYSRDDCTLRMMVT